MANGETSDIKINWLKVVAWTMTTSFTLLLALVIFVFQIYATKIDDLVKSNSSLELKVEGAVATLQAQNSGTSGEISNIKDDIKEIKIDIRELRK